MKILIVSDDVLFARLAANKLEKWNHSVVIETSCSTAFERIKKEPFRLVLTGWEIDGMSGLDLARKVRKLQHARYTYILMYTERSDKESMIAALEAGADEFMSRPFNAAELELRLKAAKRLLNIEDELRKAAGVDEATGLVSSGSFRHFFRVILAEARRTEDSGVLVFVHVVNHRAVAETQGTALARLLIHEIGRALDRSIRESDLVVRWGDDEFCLALQNTTTDRCARVIKAIDMQLQNMVIFIEETQIRPQIRISTMNYPAEDLSADEILASSKRVPYAAAS